jgi:gluconokinase
VIVILMGVVGSGKTTVGRLLASKLGWEFADADNFHSPENIRKISQGIALTDDDRAPWLAHLRSAIQKWNADGRNVALACSALKHSYREELRSGAVQFVYLKGDYDLIDQRLSSRRGHFASDSILKSQFLDLEEPSHALVVDIGQPPGAIADEIITKLKLTKVAYPSAASK